VQLSDRALFFGDSDVGYALSHTFDVHNAQARGARARYSIVVSTGDRSDQGCQLLHQWVFLTAHVAEIVAEIQAKVCVCLHILFRCLMGRSRRFSTLPHVWFAAPCTNRSLQGGTSWPGAGGININSWVRGCYWGVGSMH
jgi:hypothetical protein